MSYIRTLLAWGVLPLSRDADGLFYIPSSLGQNLFWLEFLCIYNFMTPTYFRFKLRKPFTPTYRCLPVYKGISCNHFVYIAGTSGSVKLGSDRVTGSLVGETWVLSQVASYQRLWKWHLIPPCLTLSNIWYVSRVKWSNPEKGVAPSSTPWCSS